MNRRDFLKSLAAGMAVAAVPSLIAKEKTPAVIGEIGRIDGVRFIETVPANVLAQFENGERYGNILASSSNLVESAINVLKEDIRKALLPSTRYELLMRKSSQPFQRFGSFAWYADGDMQRSDQWEQAIAIDNPELLKDRGVYRIGRLVVS